MDEFRDLKGLVRWCTEPDKIELMIDLIEDDQGYPLYKAISDAKARLSSEDEVELRFPPLGDDFDVRIMRGDFEEWIADDLRRMERSLDSVMSGASIDGEAIDKVFLTGGTSFVPAVRAVFERRFGSGRIESGDELLSIANGLAMIGERDDADQWAVAETPERQSASSAPSFSLISPFTASAARMIALACRKPSVRNVLTFGRITRSGGA